METELASARNHPEYQYLNTMRHIMENGVDDRAKHVPPGDQGIRCMLGFTHRYDLERDGFPAITTKDLYWKGVTQELKWFLNGDTNIKSLVDNGVNIWNGDAYRKYDRAAREGRADNLTRDEYVAAIKGDADFAAKWGDLGRVYGAQWRRWKTSDGREIDQLQKMVDNLRDPIARYRKNNIVTAWDPETLPDQGNNPDEMALPPCHMIFQADVDESNNLSLILTQRSADMFLGVPFNIASYALLTHVLAEASGLKASKFIHQLGNAHVYHSHFDAVKEQLERTPLPFPRLQLQPNLREIDDFRPEEAKLINYQHHGRIKAKMLAVGGIIDNPVALQERNPQ